MFQQSAHERRAMLHTARAVLAHGGTEEERRSAFPDFQLAHPKLFRIVCSGRCELSYLETMLRRMEDIEAGRSTVDDASKEISETLNRDYIESVIPPPTEEQAAGPGKEHAVEVTESRRPAAAPLQRVGSSLPCTTQKGVKRSHDGP